MLIVLKHEDQCTLNEEVDRIINFEGPHGPIEVIVVKDENSTALSDLYSTIAEIMVRQAKKKAQGNH
jgi:hypothetical protein